MTNNCIEVFFLLNKTIAIVILVFLYKVKDSCGVGNVDGITCMIVSESYCA
jgi:hypothetical protein